MTHLSRPSLVLAAVSFLGVLLGSPSAGALEGEWHAGARLGIATLAGRSLGPAFDVHGAYELNDMFQIVAQGTGSTHAGSPQTDVLSASGGLAYKIDVFEWIPYVSLLGGYYHYDGLPGPHRSEGSQAGASAHAGLDYLALRQLALGADFGWHTSLHGFTFPYFTALVGAEYRFGF